MKTPKTQDLAAKLRAAQVDPDQSGHITGTPAPDRKTDFAWQLEILFDVLGATHTAREVSFAGLADIMDISPSGITQRCNGKTVLKPSEANRIIAGYGLNAYGLDRSLFDLTDPSQFREELRKQGVGIHGGGFRLRMAKQLDKYRARKGLSIEITLKKTSNKQRGLAYASDPSPPNQSFVPGEQVQITVQGMPGRHIAILQNPAALPHVIDVLSPTATYPETLLQRGQGESGRLSLPQDNDSAIKVARPRDEYRVVAVEGPAAFIQLFGADDLKTLVDDDHQGPLTKRAIKLSETGAKQLLQWLEQHPNAEIRTAECFFYVSGS